MTDVSGAGGEANNPEAVVTPGPAEVANADQVAAEQRDFNIAQVQARIAAAQARIDGLNVHLAEATQNLADEQAELAALQGA